MNLLGWPGDAVETLARAAPPALRAWLDFARPPSHAYVDTRPNVISVALAASGLDNRLRTNAALTLGWTTADAVAHLLARSDALDKAMGVAQRRIAALRRADPAWSPDYTNSYTPADLAMLATVADEAMRLHDVAALVDHGVAQARRVMGDVLRSERHGGAVEPHERHTQDRLVKALTVAFDQAERVLKKLIETSGGDLVWYDAAIARVNGPKGVNSRAASAIQLLTRDSKQLPALRSALRATVHALYQLDNRPLSTDLLFRRVWPTQGKDYDKVRNALAEWPELTQLIFAERLGLTLDAMVPADVNTTRHGLAVTYSGFDRLATAHAQSARRSFAAAIVDRFAAQARRYMPAMLHNAPRIKVWAYAVFGPKKTPGGHYYRKNYPTVGEAAKVVLYLPSYAKHAPGEFDANKAVLGAVLTAVTTLAHEMAHHLWKETLNSGQKELWEKTIRADVTQIDFTRLLTYQQEPWPSAPPEGWTVLRVPEGAALPSPDVFYAGEGPARADEARRAWRDAVARATGPAPYATTPGVLGPFDAGADDGERYGMQAAYLRTLGYEVTSWYTGTVARAGHSYQKIAAFIRDPKQPNPPPVVWWGEGFRVVTRRGTVSDAIERMKEDDPTLYLQVMIASSVYDPEYTSKSDSTPWRWMDTSKGEKAVYNLSWAEVAAAAAKQEKREVPRLPVSVYGAANAEEAWCDAVGLMVAYGPQAVLEPVRELVYGLLPSFRRNPAAEEA